MKKVLCIVSVFVCCSVLIAVSGTSIHADTIKIGENQQEARVFVYPKTKHSAKEMFLKNTDFVNGTPGKIGKPGKMGKSGKFGKIGKSGKSGKPGKGRFILVF